MSMAGRQSQAVQLKAMRSELAKVRKELARVRKQVPPAPPAMGRRKIIQDEERFADQLEACCKAHCKRSEITAFLGASDETIDRFTQKRYGSTFAQYRAEKGEAGCANLRRKQMELALKGDRVMLIWLGKQELGQVERSEVMTRELPPIQEVPVDPLAAMTEDDPTR